MAASVRAFTREELARYDGRGGRPAYVAFKGTVYDVTAAPSWAHGIHFAEHRAGADLTEHLVAAPHGEGLLEDLPIRGLG